MPRLPAQFYAAAGVMLCLVIVALAALARLLPALLIAATCS